jgi:hypothetical protein
MNTEYEAEKREETDQLATYRIHVIKWLLTNQADELEQASEIARAHDKSCACKECKLTGFALRHERFARSLTNKDVKSWHRLLSWFDSDGMTGFYKRVHFIFGVKLFEAYPQFYKNEYPQILARSPFGSDLKRAEVNIRAQTIEISCHNPASLFAFLRKIGLSDAQLEELASGAETASLSYDLIMGDHGKSADVASGVDLCGI